MKAANSGKRSLNRRQFLKLAGAVGIVTVPVVVGLDLLDVARGENPVEGSPYAPVDVLTSWPETPAGASPILILVNDKPGDNPFPLYL